MSSQTVTTASRRKRYLSELAASSGKETPRFTTSAGRRREHVGHVGSEADRPNPLFDPLLAGERKDPFPFRLVLAGDDGNDETGKAIREERARGNDVPPPLPVARPDLEEESLPFPDLPLPPQPGPVRARGVEALQVHARVDDVDLFRRNSGGPDDNLLDVFADGDDRVEAEAIL